MSQPTRKRCYVPTRPFVIFLNLCAFVLLSGVDQCPGSDAFYSTGLRKVDVFYQTESPIGYDFLWVLDNSGSMADDIEHVKSHISMFLNVLTSRRAVDYQMVVTTTDVITNNGNLISSSSGANIATDPATFQAIVDNVVDTASSSWEQGLEAAYLASYNHGELFMRPGRSLVIIIITDEEDYSCDEEFDPAVEHCVITPQIPPEAKTDDWTFFPVDKYIDYFTELKEQWEDQHVYFFPIIRTPESTCDSLQSSIGYRYVSVQDGIAKGAVGDICESDPTNITELSQVYQNIAFALANAGTMFILSAVPMPGTITVNMNGQAMPESNQHGFMHNSNMNAIMFYGDMIPPNGAVIEVSYDVPQP